MEKMHYNIAGLNEQEVIASRSAHGHNALKGKKDNGFLRAIKDLAKEPMFILLLAASVIYFIGGQKAEGIFMAISIVLVAFISLYQDSRSRNALAALKSLTQPRARVIRDNDDQEINSDEIVMNDIMIIEEGKGVPADGVIIQSNDFSVNESILTGESMSLYKNENSEDNKVYQGTSVSGGLAICRVTAIGEQTRLGGIGLSLASIKEENTPLQLQISNFVKKMAVVGVIVFLIVWVINYLSSYNILDSLLKALTLAMSILPEEIPVAFTTFMALGAWRLMTMGIIVKQTKTVETLGSATVIGLDKTGTITENKMTLAKVSVLSNRKNTSFPDLQGEEEKALIRYAMWASEPIPFDPMEKALHEAYLSTTIQDERLLYTMHFEYPLSGRPPMMTHIFKNKDGEKIIAAKGAPEALISVSRLSEDDIRFINDTVNEMSAQGYRVLAVGKADFTGDQFPAQQQDFSFHFIGLVAFYDPPKKNISEVFSAFYQAGINVKIITGDNKATTETIARQVGMKLTGTSLSGEELMIMDESTLRLKVSNANIFARMFPEAKLRIINSLKANGEIVAMTGDGVNDGPALKAAHIGIAMGEKGSEIARQAASLIIIDDDLGKMVEAIAMGRKIYTNLKKAIQYIISIHIPIILTVFMPLALGWVYPSIFSPVHIIFLELIMGPTCSIIYENEPIEKNLMLQKPRPFTNTFFNWKELLTSIIQGLAITAGTLYCYQYALSQGANEETTRTMVFITLVSANVFLTLVNRSFYYSIFTTARYKNNLVIMIIAITITMTALLLYIRPLTAFFRFQKPDITLLLMSLMFGFISVIWFELYKAIKRSGQ